MQLLFSFDQAMKFEEPLMKLSFYQTTIVENFNANSHFIAQPSLTTSLVFSLCLYVNPDILDHCLLRKMNLKEILKRS